MFFSNKSEKIALSCLVLFSIFAKGASVALNDENLTRVTLGRVQFPATLQINEQKKMQSKRETHRMLVTACVCTSAALGLYVAVCVGHAINEQKKAEIQWVPAEGKIPVAATREQGTSSKLPWPASCLVSRLKSITLSAADFGTNFAKFLADSTTMLAAGVISNGTWQFLQSKASQAYQDETILWFVEKQTKIPLILEDLKSRTAEYDLHSAFLSSEMLNQDTKIHVKAFIEDVSEFAASRKQDQMRNEYEDRFSYLLGEIKKKYVRKADHLESMQDQLVPLLARQSRSQMSSECADLFDRDRQARADIAYLCNQLVVEVTKLVAFIEIHQHRHQLSVQDLIDSCNKFLEHAEVMLLSSEQQIIDASKKNCGIFTATAEYERLFNQQVSFLDKYCRLVKS